MKLIEFQYIILKITAFIFKQKADTMSVNNMNEITDPLDHVGDRWGWLFGESRVSCQVTDNVSDATDASEMLETDGRGSSGNPLVLCFFQKLLIMFRLRLRWN